MLAWIPDSILAFFLRRRTSCSTEDICQDGHHKHYWVRLKQGSQCVELCVRHLHRYRNLGYECGTCFPCFGDEVELQQSVDEYLIDSSNDTKVAITYGWPIGNWCVKQITDFSYLFDANRNIRAAQFNGDIGQWNVGSAVNMKYMFAGATSFNQDLTSWNTSNVEDMTGMFEAAIAFEGMGLANWDVSKVKSVAYMFSSAYAFREDISRWNTGNVYDMIFMFSQTDKFNADLSSWNVANVLDMSYMFEDSTSFNQNLCLWGSRMIRITRASQVANMFLGTACPMEASPNVTVSPKSPLCWNCN